ncbi:MAG: nuclear transport factor 2 family protein [Gemmatimonadaceae bacterium]
MRVLTTLTALCIATLACAPTAQNRASPAAGPTVDRDAERSVVVTVERLFEAMRTRDTAVIRQLLAPELVLVSIGPGGTRAHRTQTVPDLLRAIAGSPEELRERMWSPEVRLDGPVATLWAPYDFHIGARLSHCGYDAVQLVNQGGQWIITGLTYTVRPAPCATRPG